MRLHILPDEKIINRTIETFEHVFPKENKYIILSRNGKCKYVSKYRANVYVEKYDSNDFWKIVGNIRSYSSIIVHLMTQNAVSFINNIEHDSIYWIEWGVDLYDVLLEPRGFKIFYNDDVMYPFVYKSIKRRFVHRYLKFLLPKKDRLNAIKKVRYFVPDSMYDEYPLLLRYYPQFQHLIYRDFFYYPIDQIVDESIQDELCHGNNIIVGNSGSFTGNHLEIIDKLANINLGNRKVKFSLSYGGSEEYRTYLSNYGKEKLKDKYSEITQYTPLDEYNKFLLDASFFIYNNYRQEAVGNILVALYFGGKVFLSDNSPLLKFYQSLGLVIFKVSDLSEDNLNRHLSVEAIKRNRKIIKEYYSLERLYDIVKRNFE